MRLFTADGTSYLDFNAGIGVNALGHGDPHVVGALKVAADKVWHTSNVFTIPEQERLGQRLVEATFADAVFFTNSGAEAVECAIKTARHHFFAKGEPDRYEIIAFTGSFHGRTMATIAAGGNPHYTEGFGPVVAFGIGGVMAEAIRDMSYRVAPFGLTDARAMIGEIRLRALLDGGRGRPFHRGGQGVEVAAGDDREPKQGDEWHPQSGESRRLVTPNVFEHYHRSPRLSPAGLASVA